MSLKLGRILEAVQREGFPNKRKEKKKKRYKRSLYGKEDGETDERANAKCGRPSFKTKSNSSCVPIVITNSFESKERNGG